MSKDMGTMATIQREKERDVSMKGLQPLDTEGVALANSKLWNIDDPPVTPVDPLR